MSKRARVGTVGRRRTITDEPILPPEEEGDDPFTAALTEFGESEAITLEVYRYDPMTGKARYAKSVPYQKGLHGLEWLQRFFGAGDYLLRFYNAERRSKNRTVSIDDPPGAKHRDVEPERDSGRDELVKLLQRQNEIFLTALVGKGGGGAASSPPTESPVVMKILEVLLPQAVAKPPDTSGLMLSMLEKGIGIAMDAKSEGEGGMAGLIRSVAKELGPVLQEYARTRMMAPPSMMVRPAPASPPVGPPMLIAPPPSPPPASSPPPGAPTNGPAPEDAARAMVEGIVSAGVPLVENAWRAQEKPEDVADWILGEVAPNYYQFLEGLTVEKLKALSPRYGAIDPAWLGQVLAHVEQAITEGETSAPESP